MRSGATTPPAERFETARTSARRDAADRRQPLRGARPHGPPLRETSRRAARARSRPRSIAEADAIAAEDIEACRAHRRATAPSSSPAARPSSRTATPARSRPAGYGTALGVIRGAVEAGKAVRVLACETRPFLQGARLTAWELARDGIPVEVITDGMGGHFLSRGEIAAVVVGADRIAANGDTANKIGTYSLAVLAKENGVPVLRRRAHDDDRPRLPRRRARSRSRSALPARSCPSPASRSRPAGVAARHPAFDVTPARYITAIVTDEGICRPPYAKSLAERPSREARSELSASSDRPLARSTSGYNGVMKNARISELRDKLSEYLARVRKGETVIVYDRDTPIARIEPDRAGADERHSGVGARRGTPGNRRRRREIRDGARLPPPVKTEEAASSLLEALLEERRTGR